MNLQTIKLWIGVLAVLLLTVELEAKTGRYRLVWQKDPSSTMGIGWDQLSGNGAKVYFDVVDHGQFPTKYAFSKTPDNVIQAKGMSNHFVHLEGLRPNTVYYFVIGDSGGSSRVLSFKTAPSNNSSRLSIIAGSDSRNHRKARVDANKMVSKLRPHCIMFGGDFTENDTDSQWLDWFDDWQNTISSDGRMYPLIVARGNHEYSNKTLMQLFDIKNKNIRYAFNLGGDLLRIYTLNSMMASGGEQRQWLQRDLAQNPHITWKTAHYHLSTRPHCKVKSENNDQWGNWSKLFYEYGVNFVVESDAHTVKATHPIRPSTQPGSEEGFIRDDEKGTVYVGEGCWGAPLRRNDDKKSWTQASGSFNSFHWIFVDKNRIEIRFVKTDGADKVQELRKGQIFRMPTGINIWNPPSMGDVIVIEKYSDAPLAMNLNLNSAMNSRGKVAEAGFEILDLKVNSRNADVVVAWRAVNETPRTKYEVLRSVNNGKFKIIKLVKAKGAKESKYSYTDPGFAVNNPDSKVVYRVREQGLANDSAPSSQAKPNPRNRGTTTGKKPSAGSDIVKVDATTNRGMVKFICGDKGEVKARLFKGKEFIRDWKLPITKPGPQRQAIDFKGVAKGNYMLVIYSKSSDVIKKIKVKK